MKNLSNIQIAKAIMNEKGFRTQKKYGQNFLMDESVLDDILDAAEVNKDDFVLEIGPGIGTLSDGICERAGKALLIEVDEKLIPILHENLQEYENVEIINDDVMKLDLVELLAEKSEGRPVKIVANLPYYITTPVLMKIMRGNVEYKSITVMVQKEVAERMEATPGTKSYGALSLAVQFYTNPKIIEMVPAAKFFPAPKVDSCVIHMDRKLQEYGAEFSEDLLFEVIKASFVQRRKLLYNGLANSPDLGLSKDEAKKIICSLGFEENIRGEKLGLDEFINLSVKIRAEKR
jgi:16S rRNA (adenine1518-N6/adenine1519-N6)-dimethyltransferase